MAAIGSLKRLHILVPILYLFIFQKFDCSPKGNLKQTCTEKFLLLNMSPSSHKPTKNMTVSTSPSLISLDE